MYLSCFAVVNIPDITGQSFKKDFLMLVLLFPYEGFQKCLWVDSQLH